VLSRSDLRAAARTAVFLMKLFPMLPSRAIDWVTRSPVIEVVKYRTTRGDVQGDLYRPSGRGPHPGVVVCLGVVPFGVEHPQVARLGMAFARSGFATLLYWSPAMRDLRMVPEDVVDLALAYRWLIGRADIDPLRSGLIGTCVGGSFALMAAASAAIRDRVGFVGAFAPYSSMYTFVRDIASATSSRRAGREAWAVDPLTRKVYVRSITDVLARSEAEVLRAAFADGGARVDTQALSADGLAVFDLLSADDLGAADAALAQLPTRMRQRLDAMSPVRYLGDVHAPHILFGHDRDDLVIPVGESRRLQEVLAGRRGVEYTEFAMFEHADPSKRHLSPLRMAQQLGKFYRYVFPLFRHAV